MILHSKRVVIKEVGQSHLCSFGPSDLIDHGHSLTYMIQDPVVPVILSSIVIVLFVCVFDLLLHLLNHGILERLHPHLDSLILDLENSSKLDSFIFDRFDAMDVGQIVIFELLRRHVTLFANV